MIKNDREFWDWYVARLVSDSKFERDIVARKTFSKLRTSIAGLYAARGYQAGRNMHLSRPSSCTRSARRRCSGSLIFTSVNAV
jgi:hypothetical protein